MTAGAPSHHAAPGRRPSLLILVPSADMYGSDRALLGALAELVERFEVTMVAAVDGPMLSAARALGVEVVVSPDWALRRRFFTPTGIGPALWRVARSLRLLRSLDARRSFDVVYANTVANTLLPFIRLAVRAPLLVHVREVPRTSGRLNDLFFGQISRVASMLVCNSTYTAEFVAEAQPALASRIRVIHNGVATVAPGSRIQVIHDGVDTGEGVDHEPRSGALEIVCVGRIHPQKGQAVMIEALRLGVDGGHDWRVHFWGDALPEHQELFAELRRQVAAASLQDRVTWHGYSGDTGTLYRGMDVAVVPSTWPEGFSLVTAEAQAAGLPAIATGPGGPTDIIDDGVTGRLIGFNDPAALVAALVEMEDDATRLAWGEAGRRRCLEKFGTERYARQVADALSGLVDQATDALPAAVGS